MVSGTQAALFPAYRPSFQPIPLLDVMRPSTPPSKHFQHGSPSSSSSQLSREDVSSEQDANSCVHVSRYLSPGGSAAASTLCREESRDSGGIFVTPPSSSSPIGPSLRPVFNATCRNDSSSSTDLPTTSLADVGRKLFSRHSDNGDIECRSFVSRNSSPGDLRAVTEASNVERSADDSSDALLLRRTSCYGVLYHRADEEFVTPSKAKKKTKKSRRNSQPAAQVSCSSTKSMVVYGGNPKWIWRS